MMYVTTYSTIPFFPFEGLYTHNKYNGYNIFLVWIHKIKSMSYYSIDREVLTKSSSVLIS